ncbi:hypothetical protein QBC39DRAFT_372308 [Podospora conica]|nr:hypothetical protein QBC39DRAFT_372308 [Schizothecium conicum]
MATAAASASSSGAGRRSPSLVFPMGGTKHYDLNENDAPRLSDQAQRFVLFAYLLHRSGMCAPDRTECLFRYIQTLSKGMLELLKLHFPHCEKKLVEDGKFLIPDTLEGLAVLGDPAVLTPAALADLLRTALYKFTISPGWAYGCNGFFLWTASKACQRPVKGLHRPGPSTGFWIGELENAIWVGVMARALVLTHGMKQPVPGAAPKTSEDGFSTVGKTKLNKLNEPKHTEPFPDHTRQAFREGLYTLFNLTQDAKHFNKHCVCRDKVFAYDNKSYPENIYTEDVVPLNWPVSTMPAKVTDEAPAKSSDDKSAKVKISDEEMALRNLTIKRVVVNLVATCDELIWPEMEADAVEAANRRNKGRGKAFSPAVPVDHTFTHLTIDTLFKGKQRPFSSRIITAHWEMATPWIAKTADDNHAFAAKIRRGGHVMAFDPHAPRAEVAEVKRGSPKGGRSPK